VAAKSDVLGQGAAQEPPHDAAAEESVVGAALLAPQAIEACADLLSGPEFYRPSLGLVWQEALAMWRGGQPRRRRHAARPPGGVREALTGRRQGAPARTGADRARHRERPPSRPARPRLLPEAADRGGAREGALRAMNGMPPSEVVERLEKAVLSTRRPRREGVGDADAERQRPVRPVPPRARRPARCRSAGSRPRSAGCAADAGAPVRASPARRRTARRCSAASTQGGLPGRRERSASSRSR
jgi:hypothetical protein